MLFPMHSLRAALPLSCLFLVTQASPFANLDKRGACSGNNCNRAVEADSFPSRPTLADCSSYLAVTVTPCTVTYTHTASATEQTSVTNFQTVTSTVVGTQTIYTTLTQVSTDDVFISSTTTVTETSSSAVAGAQKLRKKNACSATTTSGSSVPTYASACSNAAAYSSACGCIGVYPFTVTVPAPSTTITITTSSTATQTLTSISTALTTETVSDTETATVLSTTTVSSTEIATSTIYVAPASCTPGDTPAPCFVAVPAACDFLNTPGQTWEDLFDSFGVYECTYAFGSLSNDPGVTACLPESLYYSSDPTTTAYNCLLALPIYCAVVNGATPDCGITNGGFETGDTSLWTFTNNFNNGPKAFQISVTSTLAHSGTYSMQVGFPDTDGDNESMTQDVIVVPGAEYELSFWYYQTDSSAYCGGSLSFDPQEAYWDGSFWGMPANQWNQVSFTFTTAQNFGTVDWGFYCNMGPSQTMYFDDFTLIKL